MKAERSSELLKLAQPVVFGWCECESIFFTDFSQ